MYETVLLIFLKIKELNQTMPALEISMEKDTYTYKI